MKRCGRARLLAALVGAVCLLSGGHAQVKPKATASAAPCPDKVASTGTYRNRYFGFAVVIPAGRTGIWNSGRCVADEKLGCVCLGPDHGRIIPLAEDAAIEVFAGFGRTPQAALAEYEQGAILLIQERSGVEQTEVLSTTATRLGSLAARRFVVRIVAQGKIIIEERIIALAKDVEYELTLRSPESRYQQDKREFERVVTSWRLISQAR